MAKNASLAVVTRPAEIVKGPETIIPPRPSPVCSQTKPSPFLLALLQGPAAHTYSCPLRVNLQVSPVSGFLICLIIDEFSA